MKTISLRLVFCLCFLQLGLATSAPAAAIEDELDAITERIIAKVQAGQSTETDLARELNELSDLFEKYRTQKSIAAQILLNRALVYERFIKDREMAMILFEQVAVEYPRTPAGALAASTVEAARATADDAPPPRSSSSRPASNSSSSARPTASRNRPSSASTEATSSRHAPLARLGGTPEVGSEFPNFSVQDLEGAPLSLDQFRGQVVLVDFWATWCQPCVAEMDNVMAAYRKYHDKGFEIVGISLDHDRAPLVNFVRRRTITWPQHFDEGGALQRRYGIRAIPATFLLDREGKVVAVNLRGAALDRALARHLEE